MTQILKENRQGAYGSDGFKYLLPADQSSTGHLTPKNICKALEIAVEIKIL
jgi:hypothetical protein